ncbi:hypothetical protein ACF1A5_31620 [Streptomyces sp. NPDC014864]|uniref:hypothetical protein n=1 Tax=Streptomyces sp. NPDC014864 TaxID=3364924 RepID=UPI0036FB75BF
MQQRNEWLVDHARQRGVGPDDGHRGDCGRAVRPHRRLAHPRRLEQRQLITCHCTGIKITLPLLREDGSGKPYDRPPRGDTEENLFLQIPANFWTKGYDEQLDLPALALLLFVARGRAARPVEGATGRVTGRPGAG